MTHIWVPKVKIIEAQDPVNPAGRVEGEYTLTRVKADGRVVQTVGPFKNLITNAGLDRLGTGNFYSSVFVGSGSISPAFIDTNLATYVAHTNIAGAFADVITRDGTATTYWVGGSKTTRFPIGEAAGNLTEVGVGIVTGGSPLQYTLSSRALIVDGGGSPVSISVLSDEYLDVTYTTRWYPPLGADAVQTVTFSGVPYTFTTRALNVGANSANPVSYFPNTLLVSTTLYTGTAAGTPPTLAAVTASTMLNSGASDTVAPSASAYVAGTHQRDYTWTAGLADCNFEYGIRGMTFRPYNGNDGIGAFSQMFQTTISPAIPKDNTKILSGGFRFSWARH